MPPLARAAALLGLVAPLLAATPAAAQGSCAVPQLLVVLDASGSMDAELSEGTRRWDAASDAVRELAGLYWNAFSFALVVFPSDFACDGGRVAVPFPGTAEEVQQALGRIGPTGGTPLAAALAIARSEIVRGGDPERRTHVLVVTDGTPNCNARLLPDACTCTCSGPGCDCDDPRNCLDDDAAVLAVQQLVQDGVPVHVLGLGDDVAASVLDELAVAGGRPRPEGGRRHWAASDTEGLRQALALIAESVDRPVRPCEGPCGPGVERCIADVWQACDAPQPGVVGACVEAGCAGTRTCTASGWSPCVEVAIGELAPCRTPCGEGLATCVAPGVTEACPAPGLGASRRCKGDEASCGGGDEVCTEEGWSACDAPRLGDRRPCPRPPGVPSCPLDQVCELEGFTACVSAEIGAERACDSPCGEGRSVCQPNGTWTPCEPVEVGQIRSCATERVACGAGVQRCDASGWSACEAPYVGTEEPCTGPCGEGIRRCQPDGSWSTCYAENRPCTDGCENGGLEVCGDDGWGPCLCHEVPDLLAREDGCGCGGGAGASGLALLAAAIALGLARRR